MDEADVPRDVGAGVAPPSSESSKCSGVANLDEIDGSEEKFEVDVPVGFLQELLAPFPCGPALGARIGAIIRGEPGIECLSATEKGKNFRIGVIKQSTKPGWLTIVVSPLKESDIKRVLERAPARLVDVGKDCDAPDAVVDRLEGLIKDFGAVSTRAKKIQLIDAFRVILASACFLDQVFCCILGGLKLLLAMDPVVKAASRREVEEIMLKICNKRADFVAELLGLLNQRGDEMVIKQMTTHVEVARFLRFNVIEGDLLNTNLFVDVPRLLRIGSHFRESAVLPPNHERRKIGLRFFGTQLEFATRILTSVGALQGEIEPKRADFIQEKVKIYINEPFKNLTLDDFKSLDRKSKVAMGHVSPIPSSFFNEAGCVQVPLLKSSLVQMERWFLCAFQNVLHETREAISIPSEPLLLLCLDVSRVLAALQLSAQKDRLAEQAAKHEEAARLEREKQERAEQKKQAEKAKKKQREREKKEKLKREKEEREEEERKNRYVVESID